VPFALLDGRAHVLLQDLGGDARLQVLGSRAARGVPERTVVELREGLADLLLGDLQVLHEDRGHVDLVHAGVADGVLYVLLRDQALVHEVAVLRRLVAARRAVLVVEGDAEDLGQLLAGLLVLGGEGAAAALVDELEDAQQVLLEEDGGGQDLLRAEARGLVPARIELEVWMKTDQLARDRRRS
jgi:hypothetical protein